MPLRPSHGTGLLLRIAALAAALAAAPSVAGAQVQGPVTSTAADVPAGPAGSPDAASPPSATAETAETASGHVTARGYIGVYLLGLRALDVVAGTFDADLHVWIRTRVGADVDVSGLTAVNGNVTKEEIGQERVSGRWKRRLFRMSGTFRADFSLASFPFDRHTLPIIVYVPDRSARELMLEPDVEGSGVVERLVIPGWTFEKSFGAHAAVVPLAARFGEDSGERAEVHFKVFIERPVVSLLMKILIPLLLCLVMSHGAFFVAPLEFGTRATLITTAIFAAIGVHYALAEMLPSTNYLTIADVYFMLVYVFLLIELVASVISHALLLAHRDTAVRRVDIATRILAPLVFLSGLVFSSWTAAGDRLLGPVETSPLVTSARPELKVGLARLPGKPGIQAEASMDRFLRRLAAEPLVEPDAEGRPRAVLAASVPSYRNDSLRIGDDQTTRAHWTIRRGARWGDGRPVTGADVVAGVTNTTFVTFPGAREVTPTEGKDGELDVTYAGIRPNVIFGCWLFPMHRLKDVSLEECARIANREPPPLSGPFVLASREEEGRLLRYVRNEHRVPRAALERVTVRVYPTREELHAAFERGDVDLVPPGDVTVAEARLLASRVAGAEALLSEAPYVWHLDVNLDSPLLQDRRVRRALLMAIDRDRIVREATGGEGRIAHSWLGSQHPLYDSAVKRVYHDPRAAARLLDEAGFRVGPKGVRVSPDGTPLRFTIARGDGHPREPAEAIAHDWGRLGIEVVHEVHPQAEYVDQYLQQRLFPHFAFWGYDIAPYETGLPYWTESMIPNEENGWRGRNTCGFRDPRIESIYDEVRQTIILEDQQEFLERQQRIYAEELPSLPLYSGMQAVLTGPGVEGVRPHIQGEGMLAWNAAEWRFAAKRKLNTSTKKPAAGVGGK